MGASPRHAHEFSYFEDHPPPENKVLCPGLVEPQSPYIEHPELIAQRIGRYAELLGSQRVMAGVDCGFSVHSGSNALHPEIVWAKLGSLPEDACDSFEEILQLRQRSLRGFADVQRQRSLVDHRA